MKTVWKTMVDQRQAQTKRREFEAKTGLAWQTYHTGAGQCFTPVITNNTPLNDETAKRLLPYLAKDYEGFVSLAARTGLTLTEVLIGAKTLARQRRAIGAVNRMGGFAAIRVKRSYK